MSIEGQVLGTSFIAGGGAGGVASLANTGNPLLVGLVAGVAMIVVLGLITRASQRQ